MSENEEVKTLPEAISEVRSRDHKLLAKMIIRDGKSFQESALAAGYSRSVAKSGLKRLLSASQTFSDIYNAESDLLLKANTLKPMAIKRLFAEIADFSSPLGMKAIELAGRLKENDWFVRNAELQVGVFTQIGDSGAGEAINTITQYKEEDEE